jgi:hypothetical protein
LTSFRAGDAATNPRRHPEEPRILRGVSKDGRERRCLRLSFEARREGGEHLRMTAEYFGGFAGTT